MLTENENVFKSYIMEKSVLPKLKKESKIQKSNRGSIFRADTITAMNNLIHQKTFINEIRNSIMTSKQKHKSKNAPISPPSGKKVTFSGLSQSNYKSRPFSNNKRNETLQTINSNDDLGMHYFALLF